MSEEGRTETQRLSLVSFCFVESIRNKHFSGPTQAEPTFQYLKARLSPCKPVSGAHTPDKMPVVSRTCVASNVVYPSEVKTVGRLFPRMGVAALLGVVAHTGVEGTL